MDYKLIKDQVAKKFDIAQVSLSIAGFLFAVKFIFGNRKQKLTYDERSQRRRKLSRKIRKLFDFQNEQNSQLRFTQKDHMALDNYSKLKEYSSTMVTKAIGKEQITNPKIKQDYIFYQILNGMQDRFKHKTIMN